MSAITDFDAHTDQCYDKLHRTKKCFENNKCALQNENHIYN